MKDKTVKIEELGKTVMPIVGFWGPPDEAEWGGKIYPSLKTDEVFSLIKESGVNLILQDNDTFDKRRESVEKALDLCAKYNLFYYVSPTSDIRNFKAYHNQSGEYKAANAKTIAKAIEPFISHPACAGLFVVDEPSMESLSAVGEFIEYYKKALLLLGLTDKGYYVNLLPVTSFLGRPTIERWKEYLETAIKNGKLDYLSYDFYPFQSNFVSKDRISPGLYNHMEAMKEVSRDNNDIPYGVCVPTGGYWTEEADNPSVRRPEPEEIEWIVNTHLAFGCKMITYFTLCNPISFFKYLPHGATGVLTPDGQKSSLFYAVKKANAQIAAVDEYLMQAKNQCVMALGDVPSEFEYMYRDHIWLNNSSCMELVYAEGDGVLIGYFVYNAKSMFYVVNTFKKEQKVKLVFNGNKEMQIVNYNGERIVRDSEISLSLAKGGATLVIITKWLL